VELLTTPNAPWTSNATATKKGARDFARCSPGRKQPQGRLPEPPSDSKSSARNLKNSVAAFRNSVKNSEKRGGSASGPTHSNSEKTRFPRSQVASRARAWERLLFLAKFHFALAFRLIFASTAHPVKTHRRRIPTKALNKFFSPRFRSCNLNLEKYFELFSCAPSNLPVILRQSQEEFIFRARRN
jgi:hypothetical protein